MNQERKTWAERWDAFTRRHPLAYYIFLLALGFLTGPLILAASSATAVLYKDF
jgi:hypothetical protein